ncbi:DNA repair protein RecN [Thaumasiovibrio subtropicus]|uniref:DNA repair protein RecN n=1 Tax=Thaumasiovibrio subtropicus TaxID=1891207 RepID=UPI000B359C66|nr:DNA repair protein RecN [Thaumasiovibrio subtropicus]
MLTHMTIANFAIVKQLDFELMAGMTTITGETGAGKSIAIDALGLCLGDRAEASMVRPGEEKAEINATFALENNTAARRWLEDNELMDGEECILRRVITKEGRSRGFINGSPVPASQQRALGQLLINIHGQHAHQQLVKPEHQLNMLDQYAGHIALIEKAQARYQTWRQSHNHLKSLIQNRDNNMAQKQLLEYQVKELNELNVAEGEFEQIEEEHKRLSNSSELAATSQQVLDMLFDGEEVNVLQLLQTASHKLIELNELDSQLAHLAPMVEEATIQIQETSGELRNYMESMEMDPERFHYLDERLGRVMSLARKHYVQPDELYTKHQQLLEELSSLDCSDEKLEELQQQVDAEKEKYLTACEKLSKSRQRYAKELNKKITSSMHELSMEHGTFCIDVSPSETQLTPRGFDRVDFLVSTNPGQPLSPLAKVASGGELSRISLAIQVITAQKVDTPSLIFDEVDVGISGPTAAVVGKLLRQLGQSTQVMCVTHLPQVAGCGHQQMFVAKKTQKGQTETRMKLLDSDARVGELARLLGGSEITDTTLANARELLIAA